MTIKIYLPNECATEAQWTCGVLFNEFLGIDFEVCRGSAPNAKLSYQGRTIEIPYTFFNTAGGNWHGHHTLPKLPLAGWDVAASGLTVPLVEQPLPVLFGKPELEITENTIIFGVDILGTVFFMLSRYEEAVLPDRDNHDRFEATTSIAYRARFLDRPIVDEYVEVLWEAIKRLWPRLKRKVRHPRTLVSCDVDAPYVCPCDSPLSLIKRLGGDAIKRRSLPMAWQTLTSNMPGKKRDLSCDPHMKALDWIMNVNEKAGNQVAFYFITAHSHPTLDGCYNMDEPVIRDLLRRIAVRGHEIGLHASYNTYQDAVQTKREADVLRRVMKEEGIEQNAIGGRQHFLRWQTPETARNWDAAGMNYDSTLSFAECPGFRCGTCHEFPMYDVVARSALNLRQRPLIVMECSVIDERYLGLGYSEEAVNLMLDFKNKCYRFSGDFTLLWHNSHFTTEKDNEFYLKMIG